MDTARVARIHYKASGRRWVASGLLVRDNVVLTAGHVADGAGHVVKCNGRVLSVADIVRFPEPDVDLAVLSLSERFADIEEMAYARVDRNRTGQVEACVAVGFPKWRIDWKKRRVTAQVRGYVPTGDGIDPEAPDQADSELLTLVCDQLPGSQPPIPAGSLATPASPWGGMSGAVVIAEDPVLGEVIIGVVRSHNAAQGGQSLTMTPLTVLRRLAAGDRRGFSAALGLRDLDALPVLPRAEVVTGHDNGRSFTAAVRIAYADELADAGLPVPGAWNLEELSRLREEASTVLAAETLDALCTALRALPLFEQVGGSDVSARTLRHLYQRHVGCPPDADTAEGMLILAASAGSDELRSGDSLPNDLTALARFMLGVAGHRRARDKAPGDDFLDDPVISDLVDWLAEQFSHQRADAKKYLVANAKRRTWALIELRADDTDPRVRAWPDKIILDLVPERGDPETSNVDCAATSDEGVRRALRDVVTSLPRDVAFVDLLLSRRWLEAGVEHWDVIDLGVGGACQTMGQQQLEPRLRWAMYSNSPWAFRSLERQFGRVNWSADPEEIPAAALGDKDLLGAWIKRQDRDGVRHPPFFAGQRRGGHDPLVGMLAAGHGLMVWLDRDDIWQDVVAAARATPAGDRRHELPRTLTARLAAQGPVIIWNDPDGRDDFALPAYRRGMLQGGSQ